jgi:hypothetical protein
MRALLRSSSIKIYYRKTKNQNKSMPGKHAWNKYKCNLLIVNEPKDAQNNQRVREMRKLELE